MKAKHISVLLILVTLGILTASSAIAEPAGTNISVKAAETAGNSDPSTPVAVEAYAGNVTELFINSTSVTDRWQGFYGNITGRIVLDDAYNYSMYDWDIADPSGEVYAANASSVIWADIQCLNFSADAADTKVELNITEIEEDLMGAGINDIDGVNETFNLTYTDATGFQVGAVTINTDDECALTYIYVSDAYQQTDYKEVILTDNVSVVWTTLLETDGTTGYDSNAWDFQMIVGEDGDVSTATNYYFYVEIA